MSARRATLGLSPELELLASVCRREPTMAGSESAAALMASPLDWERFCDLARRHMVVPLVYRNLVSLGGTPAPVLDSLHRAAAQALRWRLACLAKFVRVARAFHERGLRFATFKGFTLEQRIYGTDPREIRDLDFLVDPESVAEAVEILLGLGFRCRAEGAVRQVGPERFLAARAKWVYRDSQGLAVDLHWRAEWSGGVLRFQDAEVWNRLETVTIAGVPVRTPGVTDLFHILVLHGISHRWQQLRWSVDVAELIERATPDELELAVARLHAVGARSKLSATLWLLESLWGGTPPSLLRVLGEGPAVHGAVRRTLIGAMERHDKPGAGLLEVSRFYVRQHRYLRLLGGGPGRQLAALTRPGLREWDVVGLPRRLYFLYYLIRPLRRLVVSLFRLTRGRAVKARS